MTPPTLPLQPETQLNTPVLSPAATAGPQAAEHFHALLHAAAIFPLDAIGWIRVSGQDRVRWLNGMVTNSIQDLQPGQGCYNFVLNAQGRIQGDAIAFVEDPAAILLETCRARLPGLIALLERFIIMDDVELADLSSTRSGLSIAGPRAAQALTALGLEPPPSTSLSIQRLSWPSTRSGHSSDITLIAAYSPLVPRFELWCDPATLAELARELAAAGIPSCGPASLEWLSLLEGTPRLGADIRDRDLPQETGQARALHFTKGCYLGQEIVERIRSRGAVHRAFSGFLIAGDLPPAGAALELQGKPAGELTRTAAIPLPSGVVLQLGLGYLRREALERGTPLTFPGGHATPVPLPYRPS